MRYFIYAVMAIVAAVVVAGFFIVGSPTEERLRRFDDQRVMHLENIQNDIANYYQAKGALPSALAQLNDEFRGIIIPKDPESGLDYEYQAEGNLSFTLCANFNRPSRVGKFNNKLLPTPARAFPGPFKAGTWEHAEGRVCFDRTIDKDFFKRINQEPAR